MHKTLCEGSVRVDLLGGTLDLWPINHIIGNVVTLNAATSLKAKVLIEDSKTNDEILLHSKDYDSSLTLSFDDLRDENLQILDQFGPFSLSVLLLAALSVHEKKRSFKVTLSSGSPPGAGLGGSSAMAMTLLRALCEHFKIKAKKEDLMTLAQNCEAKVLNLGPTGYQDYYPALYGGILSLESSLKLGHSVNVRQHYTKELSEFLQNHLTLCDSTLTRSSGLSNWRVYQDFFSHQNHKQEGLRQISELSQRALDLMLQGEWKEFVTSLCEEGRVRAKFFPDIIPEEMTQIESELKSSLQSQYYGMKMCGAGGGGCFLIAHDPEAKNKIQQIINASKMRELSYQITPPLEEDYVI